MRYILSSFYLLNVLLVPLGVFSQSNTVQIGSGCVIYGTVAGGDVVTINTMVLDSKQKITLDSILNELNELDSANKELFGRILQQEEVTDRVSDLFYRIYHLENQLDSFKSISDNRLSKIDTDSLLMVQLGERFETIFLTPELHDLWEEYPDFNPSVNFQMVPFIESLRQVEFSDLQKKKCKANKRNLRKSECWMGIKFGNNIFMFPEYASDIVNSSSKLFTELVVSIPKIGDLTVEELRYHYNRYHIFQRYRQSIIEFQYAKVTSSQSDQVFTVIASLPSDVTNEFEKMSNRLSKLQDERVNVIFQSIQRSQNSNDQTPVTIIRNEAYKRAYRSFLGISTSSEFTNKSKNESNTNSVRKDYLDAYRSSQRDYELAASSSSSSYDPLQTGIGIAAFIIQKGKKYQKKKQVESTVMELNLVFLKKGISKVAYIYIDGVLVYDASIPYQSLSEVFIEESRISVKVLSRSHTFQVLDTNRKELWRETKSIGGYLNKLVVDLDTGKSYAPTTF